MTSRMIKLCSTWLVLGIISSLIVIGSVAAAISGDVSPASGRSGDRLTFTATGFTPAERVDLWATAPGGVSYPRYPAVQADAEGKILWTWDILPEHPSGNWTMAARGVQSNARLGIGFTVLPGTTTAPNATVEPTQGSAGTVFTFRAGGFRPNERVGAWLSSPSGANIDLVPGEGVTIIADSAGEATWQWSSPADAPGGAWIGRARGTVSGFAVAIPFTLSAEAPADLLNTVTPAQGDPGTTFVFQVGGFNVAQEVGSFLIRPDGSQVDGVPFFRADPAGVATWEWTAPSDAPGGTWRAVTRAITPGQVNNREVVQTFTLTGGTTPPPSTPASNPTVSVEPPDAAPGSSFTFRFTNFPPGDELRFGFTNPQNQPVSNGDRVIVDPDGQATWRWTAPNDALAGEWALTATGQRTRVTAHVRFSITSNAPAPAGVSPERGTPGTLFSFYGTGFRANERVGYWLNSPDGAIIAFADELIANRDGVVFFEYTATVRGQWSLVLQSSANANNQPRGQRLRHVIPFTVE